jgi:plastocyanin
MRLLFTGLLGIQSGCIRYPAKKRNVSQQIGVNLSGTREYVQKINGDEGIIDKRGNDSIKVSVGVKKDGGYRFSPNAVIIDVGTEVEWKWEDADEFHNVEEISGDYGTDYYDGEFVNSRIFVEKGKFRMKCGLHGRNGEKCVIVVV